jgi:uncharacterized membrane protein YtjA (UPF0391 family)
MLRWTLLFLVFGFMAGACGFWGLEGMAMWIARVPFVIFIISVVAFVMEQRGPLA